VGPEKPAPTRKERRGLGERAPSRSGGAADVARSLAREFYRDLSCVLQKWDRNLAALEEDERRRVVLAAQESGLLRVIRDARIAVKRYERGQMGWSPLDKGLVPKRNEQGVP
jgi:hypothetical protein